MKKLRTPHAQDAEINITSMLDIVFIMLIFFIVTSSFSKHTGLSISRNTGTISEQKDPQVIAITINDKNAIMINGQATKPDNLPSVLAHLKAANPELAAQILAADEVNTGTLVKAIDDLNTGGIRLLAVNSF